MRALSPMWLAAVLFAGCGSAEEVEPAVELLDARSQLIRLSVDLRGVHPTEAELYELEIAEDQLVVYNGFADQWVDDQRFIGRIKEVFNERYLLRTGDVYFGGLDGIDDRRMADIIANEAFALLEYVVANDMPYSYMVTADHTMANLELASYWNIDYAGENGGWAPARYNDDRPHAGMLTMTTFWQRYPSMGGNANRHRANAVSKVFLCDDYLSRPIVLNRAAVDELTIDPENAINGNTGCQSCHASLDPMAANFFGFFNYDDEEGIESTFYRPEREEDWRDYAGKAPGYYGRPTGNIPEFALELAADTRFQDCAVRTVWEGLTQRTLLDEDWPEMAPHVEAFANSDMNVKQLVLSIVKSEEYRAKAANEPGLEDRLVGAKLVSPEQLSSIMADITGYTWFFDGRDGLKNQSIGLPTLAGGIDSKFIVERTYTPGVGLVFIQERLAQAAAWHVAQHDLNPERTTEAQMLHFVTIEDTPDTNPEAFREQIRHLYLVVTGHPLAEDAREPDQLMEVWKNLYSVEASPTLAWAGVVSAVLRDPSIIFY